MLGPVVGEHHGPRGRRGRSGIGFIGRVIDYAPRTSPLPESIHADEVGGAAAFLASPLAGGITGTTLYVDKGFHAMGMAVDAGDTKT